MPSYRTMTGDHLRTARAMPRKRHPLSSVANSPEGKRYARSLARDRKALAELYRAYRRTEGPRNARIAHRYGRSTTGADARARLRQLQPAENPGPAFC